MPDAVDIRGLDTLVGLDASLRQFAVHVQEALEAVDAEVQRVREELDQRIEEREDAVERCEEEFEAARQALKDVDPEDRDDARETVREARAALAETRESLALTRSWQRRTEEQVDGFGRRQRQLLELTTTLTDRASAFLSGRYGELERYVHIVDAGFGLGAVATGSAAAGSPAAPPAPAAAPGPAAQVQTLGAPERDRQFRHYQSKENCEVVAEQGILHKHTGIDFGEDELTAIAEAKGWWTEKGTVMKDMGRLLELHGVPVKRWDPCEANMDALQNELAQGHDVIVYVHAGLWYNDDYEAGHAIWVTGIDRENGRPVRVWVNDGNPGTPECYDADHFLRAWEGLQVYGLSPMPMGSTLSAAPQRGD